MPKTKKYEKARRKTGTQGKNALSAKSKTSGAGKKKKKTSPSTKESQNLSRKIKLSISDVPKYYDLGNLPTAGRVESYWEFQSLIPYFKAFRKGPIKLPATYRYFDHEFLLKKYQLKGWEFGNWLSQEDRMNYVAATGIALYDLKLILKLPFRDIGQRGKLGITLGSRGKGGKAMAHFSPGEWIINMTRYRDYGNAGSFLRLPVPQNKKLQNFLRTGGVGAFGHEYGHALDYWIGGYFDQRPGSFSLSGGSSISRNVDQNTLKKKSPPRMDGKASYEYHLGRLS